MRYGITWGNQDHSVAQTGYEFGTVAEAKDAARRGPWNQEHQVDAMCVHFPNVEPGPLWGNIETENDHVACVLFAKYK